MIIGNLIGVPYQNNLSGMVWTPPNPNKLGIYAVGDSSFAETSPFSLLITVNPLTSAHTILSKGTDPDYSWRITVAADDSLNVEFFDSSSVSHILTIPTWRTVNYSTIGVNYSGSEVEVFLDGVLSGGFTLPSLKSTVGGVNLNQTLVDGQDVASIGLWRDYNFKVNEALAWHGEWTTERLPPWQPPAPENLITYSTVDMLSEPNGTGVSSWGDPIAFTQATAAAQPTKQADHVFVGADDTMSAPIGSLPQIGSFAFTLKVTESANVSAFANKPGIGFALFSTQKWFRMYQTDGVQPTARVNFTPDPASYYTFCGRWNQNQLEYYVSGIGQDAVVLTSPLSLGTTELFINPTASGQIGSIRFTGLWDTNLTNAQVDEVAAKWQ